MGARTRSAARLRASRPRACAGGVDQLMLSFRSNMAQRAISLARMQATGAHRRWHGARVVCAPRIAFYIRSTRAHVFAAARIKA